MRIQDILIDCGIPYAKLRDDLYEVDTLLLTHTHTDHIKPATLESIRKEFPRIRVYGNADVAYRFDVDTVIGSKEIDLGRGRKLLPWEGVHDVPVSCFLIQRDGINILYATDTNEISLPVKVPIDYCFLESNYDERKLAEIGKQYSRRGYDATEGSYRHLSTQKCKEFYYVNRRDAESPLIELHMSSRFY